MNILLLNQYYLPEPQNFYVHECALGLTKRGHNVTVVTGLPHYGQGAIYEGYRGKLFRKEQMDGVTVFRAWVHATAKKTFYPRALNFASFCISSLFAGSFLAKRPDVVYTSIPPLPLGITGVLLASFYGAKVVVHVQDIYPRVAIEYGMLSNAWAIRFFETMERWVYQTADKVIVISEGFKHDLLSKGVGPDKLLVVENWADSVFVRPSLKNNGFRKSLNAETRFVVIYSGGLNHNANIEPLVRAAHILKDEPFTFVIVGEGEYRSALEALARDLSLPNIRFMPFQPLDCYPDVLAAADMNVVALNTRSALSSVPSKIYKLMAAGRPVLAITPDNNELFRLVSTARCGLCVLPDDPIAVAKALRWSMANPDKLLAQGSNARQYLEEHHTLERSIDRLSEVMNTVGARPAA